MARRSSVGSHHCIVRGRTQIFIMDDRAVIRSFETGRRRWIAAAIFAAFLIAVLIWVVGSGFRGRRISAGANALTKPVVDDPRHPGLQPGAERR
ncbi:MAG TPA: hypothetical protein VNO55_08780 [Polyangia bacterium]|nr:hypothetical protein [Polyangia bacterium]